MRLRRLLVRLLPLALVAGGGAASASAQTAPADAVARGEYVFNAAGCLGCHTAKDGPRLAGGRALATPYGTFYSPNITPDRTHGIGAWSEDDFLRALRKGVAPDGSSYFPAFPYTSFTRMTEADAKDLWAYLKAQPPIDRPNRPHDLTPPFGWRMLMSVWKALFFDDTPLPADPGRPADWRRGRYLVQALGHCGECHTPRGSLGALDEARAFAGTPDGPEGDKVPNLTPHPDGLGKWSPGDIVTALEMGMLPDGDFVGKGMNEVVQNSTSKLTEADRKAIAAYLRSLPPLPNTR